VMLRPLRLTVVGKVAKRTAEDNAFLKYAYDHNIPVAYLSPCPKRQSTPSRRRYMKYMRATTFREIVELGASKGDIDWDYEHGFISFPKHEPDLPGHVFGARQLARQHGHTHILEDLGCYMSRSSTSETILARAFNVRGTSSFHSILETVYEPEVILEQLKEEQTRAWFAEAQMAKVLNSTGINIDFSLSPEPTRYEDVLPEVCDEAPQWRAAMDEEMRSMERFGVFRRVPRSAARGRQILSNTWVYKRKLNKLGEVYRHRARLVARGFLQRPYDSFNPDAISSPVCHKNSLRLFLSVCAAKNLKIYQADVKCAFLQAPLEEKIYMRMPPGYSDMVDGEEAVLELEKAVYGLKQSGAVFFNAMDSHLRAKGFKPTLGDPCLFRRVQQDGSEILVCVYVDDITYACVDQATADGFLSEMRERFEIEDGEGAPIEWLLGMAITQDLKNGTVKMNMEMAITKLAGAVLSPEEKRKAEGVDTPMVACGLQKQSSRTVPKEEFDYLSVVGSLLHIANCVRCDVAYAVGVLA